MNKPKSPVAKAIPTSNPVSHRCGASSAALSFTTASLSAQGHIGPLASRSHPPLAKPQTPFAYALVPASLLPPMDSASTPMGLLVASLFTRISQNGVTLFRCLSTENESNQICVLKDELEISIDKGALLQTVRTPAPAVQCLHLAKGTDIIFEGSAGLLRAHHLHLHFQTPIHLRTVDQGGGATGTSACSTNIGTGSGSESDV